MRDTIMKIWRNRTLGNLLILRLRLITNYELYHYNGHIFKLWNKKYKIRKYKTRYKLISHSIILSIWNLVDYSTSTGLKPIGIRTTDIATEDFEVTFSSFGVINYDNKTIKHTNNSSGIYTTKAWWDCISKRDNWNKNRRWECPATLLTPPTSSTAVVTGSAWSHRLRSTDDFCTQFVQR